MKLTARLFAAALWAVFLCLPAAAQWQTSNHSVPIGRGSGLGFSAVGPCNSGMPIIGNGASADPSCLGTQSANVFFAGPTTGSAADPTWRALVNADLPSNVGLTFNTVADLVAATIPSTVLSVQTLGYHTAGDGGGAVYVRSASAPSYSCYQQSADGAYWDLAERSIVNVKWCGAYGDASHDDYNAILNSMSALKTGHGTVYFPASSNCYNHATGFNLVDKSGITFRGPGDGTTFLYGTGACVNFTDNAANSGWTLDGTAGITFQNIQLSYSGAAFSGNLIVEVNNAGSKVTNETTFRNVTLSGQGTSSKSALALVHIASGLNTYFDTVAMENAGQGILGAQTTAGQFANGVYIKGVWFNQVLTTPVVAGGENWVIEKSTFEPPRGSGSTAAFGVMLTNLGVQGLALIGNQMEDATNGTWVDFQNSAGFGTPGPVYGFTATGNYLSGATFAMNITNVVGASITGNYLNSQGAGPLIAGGSSATSVIAFGNNISTSGGPNVGDVFDTVPSLGNNLIDNNNSNGIWLSKQGTSYRPPGTINYQDSNVANAADTNFVSNTAFSVPANLLSRNGDRLVLEISFTLSSATSSKTYACNIGYSAWDATTGFTGGLNIILNASSASSISITSRATITRRSSTTVNYQSQSIFSNGSVQGIQFNRAASLTLTSANNILCHARDGTGNASAITINQSRITFEPAN